MAAAKSTGISTRRKGNPKNLKPAWQKGQSGNPAGRKLGQRNRKTVIMAAIRRMAEKRDMTPEDLEELLQAAGIEKALKGSFFHWQEVNAGLYGKLTDKVDLTSGGRTLADLITIANAKGTAKPAPKRGGSA